MCLPKMFNKNKLLQMLTI